MTKVYRVTLPDPNDGAGGIDGGIFLDMNEAYRRAEDGNVQGQKVRGNVVGVPVFDSYNEFLAYADKDARNRALRKLTPRERKALGLPEPEHL